MFLQVLFFRLPSKFRSNYYSWINLINFLKILFFNMLSCSHFLHAPLWRHCPVYVILVTSNTFAFLLLSYDRNLSWHWWYYWRRIDLQLMQHIFWCFWHPARRELQRPLLKSGSRRQERTDDGSLAMTSWPLLRTNTQVFFQCHRNFRPFQRDGGSWKKKKDRTRVRLKKWWKSNKKGWLALMLDRD